MTRATYHAVIALTALGPREMQEARELMTQFDDPNEDMGVRCMAVPCLSLFDGIKLGDFPSLLTATEDTNDPRHDPIMELFKRLNAGGTTIIQVTHSEENSRYSDRIINLKDGWLV